MTGFPTSFSPQTFAPIPNMVRPTAPVQDLPPLPLIPLPKGLYKDKGDEKYDPGDDMSDDDMSNIRPFNNSAIIAPPLPGLPFVPNTAMWSTPPRPEPPTQQSFVRPPPQGMFMRPPPNVMMQRPPPTTPSSPSMNNTMNTLMQAFQGQFIPRPNPPQMMQPPPSFQDFVRARQSSPQVFPIRPPSPLTTPPLNISKVPMSPLNSDSPGPTRPQSPASSAPVRPPIPAYLKSKDAVQDFPPVSTSTASLLEKMNSMARPMFTGRPPRPGFRPMSPMRMPEGGGGPASQQFSMRMQRPPPRFGNGNPRFMRPPGFMRPPSRF